MSEHTSKHVVEHNYSIICRSQTDGNYRIMSSALRKQPLNVFFNMAANVN